MTSSKPKANPYALILIFKILTIKNESHHYRTSSTIDLLNVFPTRYATKRKNTSLPFPINNVVSLFQISTKKATLVRGLESRLFCFPNIPDLRTFPQTTLSSIVATKRRKPCLLTCTKLVPEPPSLLGFNAHLEIRRRRRQRERQKTIGLIRKTTTLHVHHAFLYISLPSLHDFDGKTPTFTFCGSRKQATTKFFFLLLKLYIVLTNFKRRFSPSPSSDKGRILFVKRRQRAIHLRPGYTLNGSIQDTSGENDKIRTITFLVCSTGKVTLTSLFRMNPNGNFPSL